MIGCQQILINGDKDTLAIIEYLCHESNDLYNCAVYYARQIWFKTKRIVTGYELTAQMKSNKHFNAGYASSKKSLSKQDYNESPSLKRRGEVKL